MRALISSPRVRAGLIASAMALIFAATALAAHPKTGRTYKGFTSETKVEGFGAPVRFRVSASGSRLLGFSYGSLGCSGAGGFKPGVNPFTGHLITKVGTVPVAGNGHFAVSGAKTGFPFTGSIHGSLTTTSEVSGRFVSASRATGTISFTQTEHINGQKPFSCGPATITFKVKLS